MLGFNTGDLSLLILVCYGSYTLYSWASNAYRRLQCHLNRISDVLETQRSIMCNIDRISRYLDNQQCQLDKTSNRLSITQLSGILYMVSQLVTEWWSLSSSSSSSPSSLNDIFGSVLGSLISNGNNSSSCSWQPNTDLSNFRPPLRSETTPSCSSESKNTSNKCVLDLNGILGDITSQINKISTNKSSTKTENSTAEDVPTTDVSKIDICKSKECC